MSTQYTIEREPQEEKGEEIGTVEGILSDLLSHHQGHWCGAQEELGFAEN